MLFRQPLLSRVLTIVVLSIMLVAIIGILHPTIASAGAATSKATATHTISDPIALWVACSHGSTIQAAFNIKNNSSGSTFSGSWDIDRPPQSGTWSLGPGAVSGTFYADPLATMHVHVNELTDDLYAKGTCISTPTPSPSSGLTNTPSSGLTNTPSNKATNTPSNKATNTPSNKATNTPTSNATNTPASNATNTPASEATNTPGIEITNTPDSNATSTPNSAITNTPDSNAIPTPTDVLTGVQPTSVTPTTAGSVVPPAVGGINSPVCVDLMVYHTNQTGDWEIFRLGTILGKPDANINLSQGIGAVDVRVSLSPDKAWVAFASNRDGNFEIYVASTDGATRRRVTHHTSAASTDPVWSIDGTNIVFATNFGGAWDLYMINVASGQEKRLTNGTGSSLNARFAPDGNSIIFESVVDVTSQIYNLNLTTMQLAKLSDGKGSDRNPTYSPDGSKIAFYSFRKGLNSVLYVMNADGSNVTAISDPSMSAINQSWSPDSTLLAYQGQNGADLGVYVYQLSTTKTRRVTDTSSVNYAPTWYCNSATLVFNSNVTGDPNLFLTQVLPIDASPIRVDTQAQQLTSVKNAAAQFAEDSPHEENASNFGPPAPNLVLTSLDGKSDLKCGDITTLSVAGGSLGFPVINTATCQPTRTQSGR